MPTTRVPGVRAAALLTALLVALSTNLVFAGKAQAVPAVAGEFAVAGGVGTDNDIVQGPDGNMWVTTCTSPAKFRLKPKKYRFLVRAVLADVADPTPASFRFKVVRSG